jgi:hypothetical protein
MYTYTHTQKKGPWDRGATRPSRAVGAASSASPRSTRKCAAVVRLRESRCKGQAKFWGAATNSFSLLLRGNIDRIASEAGARILGHAARGPVARPMARRFGPARARHGPVATGLGPARPERPGCARAARHVARHGHGPVQETAR